MLGRVFDLFVQADASPSRSQCGRGIGLTLVRRLVELHEGSVTARSGGRGRGSELTAPGLGCFVFRSGYRYSHIPDAPWCNAPHYVVVAADTCTHEGTLTTIATSERDAERMLRASGMQHRLQWPMGSSSL